MIKKAIVTDEEYEEFKLLHLGYNINSKDKTAQLTEEEIQNAIIKKKKDQILRMISNL